MNDQNYLSLKREFVFKVDNDRPIMYPIDYNSTPVFFLSPLQGVAVSLINGRRTLAELRKMFGKIFEDDDPSAFDTIIMGVNDFISQQQTGAKVGSDGVINYSELPEESCYIDPKEFVVDVANYYRIRRDQKTMNRLTSPINIYPIFTHKCAVDCVYCYAERRVMDEMSSTQWSDIFQQMCRLGVILMSPDNGDIFARKDGVQLLEAMLEHGFHFLLSTKSHVKKMDVRRLVEAGFRKKINGVVERKVQLSIDAVDDSVVRKLQNTRTARNEMNMDTLVNFLEFGISPIIKTVVTGLNYDQIVKIVKQYYALGARDFHFVKYTRTFHRHNDELFIDKEHLPFLKEQFDAVRELFDDAELEENITSGKYGDIQLSPEVKKQIWDGRIGCGGGWYSMGILPNGKVFLCEQMKMDDQYLVGDLTVQSIDEVWNGRQLLDFIFPERERFKDTICYGCDEFEECMYKQGRCYRDALFASGSIYTAPPMCYKNEMQMLRMS